MRLNYIFAAVLLCVIFITQCQKKEPVSDVVAVINNQHNIKFEDLIVSYHQNYYLKKLEKSKPEDVRKNLQNMINRKLKILDAYAMDLDENPLVIKEAQYAIKPYLFNIFYNAEIVDGIISEKEIKECYSYMGKTVNYRQIILKKPDNVSEYDVAIIKKKIDTIHQRLLTGEDFIQLAQTYSEETKSSQKGTLLKREVWKEYHNPEIQLLLTMKKGNISEAMENTNGFYLFKLEQTEKKNKPPYKKSKRDIKKYLKKVYSKQIFGRLNEIISQGVNTKSFEWNINAIEKLKLIVEAVNSDPYTFIDSLSNINQEDNMIIAEYSNGVVDFQGFAIMFREWSLNHKFSIESVQDINGLKEFIVKSVCYDYIVKQSIEKGLDKNIAESKSVNRALEIAMVKLYAQKMVEEKIPPMTEEAIRAFYETNADSLYYQNARSIVHAKTFKEKTEAENFAELAKLKKTIRGLVNEFDFKMYEINKDGSYNYLTTGEEPLADASFTLKVGEIAGPVEYTDSDKNIRFAVIRRTDKIEGMVLSYEQVREIIPKRLETFHRKRIETELIKELEEKYPVVIYEQVLEKNLGNMDQENYQ